jgi:hypothetical protein
MKKLRKNIKKHINKSTIKEEDNEDASPQHKLRYQNLAEKMKNRQDVKRMKKRLLSPS